MISPTAFLGDTDRRRSQPMNQFAGARKQGEAPT
jgi:hypothetical protein